MTTSWPWDQPTNCAVITLRAIVMDGAPILHVTHDLDDHGWQFLDGGNVKMEDAMVVTLASIVDLDPSVASLADCHRVGVRGAARSLGLGQKNQILAMRTSRMNADAHKVISVGQHGP